MAWVLESVYKQPLPTLTEQLLWQPLGAESDAFGVARPGRGYKNFFWLQSGDGSILRMAGNHSQNILIDRKSKTVMVQVAPGYEYGADEIMLEMFQSACKA
jgi:CubicO group peptidase (beta-lactamase class C family)